MPASKHKALMKVTLLPGHDDHDAVLSVLDNGEWRIARVGIQGKGGSITLTPEQIACVTSAAIHMTDFLGLNKKRGGVSSAVDPKRGSLEP